MSSKAKGVVALILVVAVLANVGIFAKMSYNKTTLRRKPSCSA